MIDDSLGKLSTLILYHAFCALLSLEKRWEGVKVLISFVMHI